MQTMMRKKIGNTKGTIRAHWSKSPVVINLHIIQ